MNKRIETNFKELKEYEEIECYYDYLEQAEHFFRDVFGDRVESQKYIIRANKEIERLNKGIKTILDIADKEKILVEEHWSSSGEHKEFYEITFDYDFLKSILVGSDKE